MGAREIHSKIKSIQNTQKITRAMEMVAASKMRKSQERMRASRPYFKKIQETVIQLARSQLEYQHPYLEVRDPKRVAFIVISTDRGLCGGLNSNLFRATTQAMRHWKDRNVSMDICTIGQKAEIFFKQNGGHVVASISHLSDRPSLQGIIGAVKVMVDAFDGGVVDKLFLASNQFVNTMTQRPYIHALLPIIPESSVPEHQHSLDYIYEPDARELLDALLLRYLEASVYQGIVENGACEQAARMIAMKNASENAANLILDLRLMYNKVRQASITRELSEIVAGAAAVS